MFFSHLKEGISFAEKCNGTNAIALALYLKQAVQTVPQQHYCNFLGKNHLYALPLCLQTKHFCLALITSQKEITREILALTNLTAHNMVHEYRLICQQQRPCIDAPPIRLTEKQREVLLCMAQGMTDKAAASELHVCLDTIKYHKRKLFELMGVDCGVSAVVAALKKEIISLEELYYPLG